MASYCRRLAMKSKFLGRTLKIGLLIFSLSGITVFMMYSDIIGRTLQSVLQLETSPGYTGGRVAAVLYDPVGDDNGSGSLTYPTHSEFVPGALDIVRYTVHEPVYHAQWVPEAEYWQLVLSFAEAGSAVRTIRIYIDADGDGSGAVAPRDEMAEGISFDPRFPWDYGIAVTPSESVFFSFDKTFSVPVDVYEADNGRRVVIRIPLRDRKLHSLYEATVTRHYVYAGAWTPWARDGFAPVSRRASSGSGGGSFSPLTPKIYDVLLPEEIDQATVLSSWNEDELTIPVLPAVEVPMTASRTANGQKTGSSGKQSAGFGLKSRIDELKRAEGAERLASEEKAAAVFETVSARYSALQGRADSALILEYALAAFHVRKTAESESAFDLLLSDNPVNPVALAYTGSIIALRGGEASPLVAVELIADAYRYLDRAVSLAETPEQIITARLNRAYVSRAIPETVFGKARQGAEDFLAAASALASVSADPADIAGAWVDAAYCFELTGAAEEAGTWLREAERLIRGRTVPASLERALLERGYGTK